MLITFEGIDGSGKSTQIELLKSKLVEAGFKVDVFREPGGSDLSEMIRGILLNPEIEIDPVAEVLLFSAARTQLVTEKVIPLLKQDRIVILDRFYDSTTAYQGYGRKSLPINQIHDINRIATKGLTPDITFYLRLNLEQATERTLTNEKDRMEQAGDTFFKRVFNGFEEITIKEKRFNIIDASKSVKKIHSEIIEILSNHIEIS